MGKVSNFKPQVSNLNFSQTICGQVVICPNKKYSGFNQLNRNIVIFNKDNQIQLTIIIYLNLIENFNELHLWL